MTTSMLGALACFVELFVDVAGVGAETGGEAATTGADVLTGVMGAAGGFVISATGAGEAVTVTLLAGDLGTATAVGVLTLEFGTVTLLVLMLFAGMAGGVVALLAGGDTMAVTLLAGGVAGLALAGLLVG